MFLRTYQNASDFLSRAQTTLEENESANSLMLGICLRLKKSPGRMKTPPYFATIEDERGLVVVACIAGYNIVLYGDTTYNDQAFEMLIGDLRDNNWSVPGVLGPGQMALDFAISWEKLTGQHYREGMRQRVFELGQVIPPQPVAGRLRVALEPDLELVTRWAEAFQLEALHSADVAGIGEQAEARIGDRDIYVWELPGKQVVSMASRARPTANTMTVNFVYTPPEYRGMGYASSCVAGLSQLLLDSGWKFCCLFTDLSNPTSNSIYQKIGYRAVCDFNEYFFEA